MVTMRRFHTWLLACALLALALPARAAEVNKYLPDDTEMVLSLNVKQMIDSPLFQKLALEHVKAVIKANDEASKMLEALGFDPFKDLTGLTMALSNLGPDPKLFVIAQGTFDTTKMAAKIEEEAKSKADQLKILKEGDHKIYEIIPPGAPKSAFAALVDKSTIVVGNDKDVVLDSFARSTGSKKSTIKKELQDLIQKADAKKSAYLVFPTASVAKNIPDDNVKKKFEKMEYISASFDVSMDIKLDVAIVCKNAD